MSKLLRQVKTCVMDCRKEIISFTLLSLALVALYIIPGKEPLVKRSFGYLPLAALSIIWGQAFFTSRKYFSLAFLFSSVALFSVVRLRLILDLSVGGAPYARTIIFSSALIAVILLVCNLPKNKLVRALLSLGGAAMLFIAPAVIWGYYSTARAYLSRDAVLALMQTNIQESLSYLSDFGTAKTSLITVIFLVFLALFAFCAAKFGGLKPLSKKTGALAVLFIALNGYAVYKYLDATYLTQHLAQAKTVLEEYDNFQRMKAERRININDDDLLFDDEAGVYIVVIGESHTKDHMSAYGYDKDTTPWLTKMRGDGHAVIMERAYSCHTHTVPVLSYALTEKNQYDSRTLADCAAFTDMAKGAGYRTIWLSNQARRGVYENPISVIADATDEQSFVGQQIYLKGDRFGVTPDANTRDCLDENILAALDSITLAPKTLIVVHLMDCHGSYRDRYDQEFARYSSDRTINAYDNAVRYNDWLMEKLYEKVSAYSNFKGLMFFADHGEDPDRRRGHDCINFTPPMAKIPCYFLLSDEYANVHPDRVANLNRAKDEIFTNDLVYNAVLGMMGVKSRSGYEPQNDITGGAYDASPERFTTVYGEIKITDVENTGATKKLWAHRCDSVEKLEEQLSTFAGVELDITYAPSQRTFDTSHDPQPGVEHPLEDFFAVLAGRDTKIWLDYKNLTAENAVPSRMELNRLLAKYGIEKSRAIVESGNYRELKAFREDGFYTSYYCPVTYDKKERERFFKSESERRAFKEAVLTAANSGFVDAVSFPVEYYDTVKESGVAIDLLTWDVGAKYKNYVYDKGDRERQKRLNDEQLKVILITSPSAFNR